MTETAKANEDLVRRFVAAYSEGRIDDALECVTDDYRTEDAAAPGSVITGRAAFGAILRTTRGALPDIREEILDLVAVEDRVAFRIRATGHHSGTEWMGVAPSGRPVSWECFGIWFVRDGRLSGEVYLDDVGAIRACVQGI